MTKPAGRRPPPVDAATLDEAAARYLARFEASAARLRRVLINRVQRSAATHGTDPEEGRRLVDALVARYQDRGLVVDERFARGKAAGLRRRGASGRSIRERLAADGVDRATAAGALAEVDEQEPAEAERTAAVTLARRRRLGPFRRPEDRPAFRDKDLAALMRAGFAWEVARAVIDGDAPDPGP